MHSSIHEIPQITDPAMEVLGASPHSLAYVGEQPAPYEDMPEPAPSSDRLPAAINNRLRTGVFRAAMAVAAFMIPNVVNQTPSAAGHCVYMGLPGDCVGEGGGEVLPPTKSDEGYGGPTNKGEFIARGGKLACEGVCADLSGVALNQDIIDSELTPDGEGLWMVGKDGGIFAYGNARFFGSTGGTILNEPVVGMAKTSTGNGYWTVAKDGGVFAFGDARFFGSTGGIRLNRPVVGMAATPSGNGYWLVASDGGIFAYGDAVFRGSAGGAPLQQPVVGMAAKPDGGGYWMAASDGGVFNYGTAGFYGSTGGQSSSSPVRGITPHRSGTGYYTVRGNGIVNPFGTAASEGWQGNLQTPATASGSQNIVSIDAVTNKMVNPEEEISNKSAA